ncbi:MAG: hypothetical protein U9O53_00180 [archaeon]|nr:hypothetical protein [archaeon]
MILLLALSIIFSTTYAQESLQCTDEHTDIHYFYSTSCSHCANVKPLLEKITSDKEKYPDVNIHYHEIHNGGDNSLFETACTTFSIAVKGVLLVVIGDTYYQGDSDIANKLEKRIAEKNQKDYHCLLTCNSTQNITINETDTKLELTWPLIITSGLIDGINPCAFAVLIFLATTLITIGNRKKMLKIGTVYITAVYITYFLAGFGLLSVIQYAGITKIIFNLATIIAIIFSLINIKDFF